MSPASEIKVGAFVLASAGLLLGGVIALGSGKFFQDTQTLETSTRDSVDGLQVGSPVKYRGVPIGEVSAISFADRLYPSSDGGEEFDYESPVVIRMKVRAEVFGSQQSELFTKDIERGVEQGLRARLRSAGLTGGLFLELDMANPVEHPVAAMTYHPDFPFVPSAPSQLGEVIAAIERITGSIGNIDFENIGTGLKEAIASINRDIAPKLDTMLGDANRLIKELEKTNVMLQARITDPRVDTMLTDAADLTAGLRTTLPSAIREYGAFGAELNALMSSEEYEIRRLLSAMRGTVENLERVTERARLDPPQLFFASPPRKLAPGEIDAGASKP